MSDLLNTLHAQKTSLKTKAGVPMSSSAVAATKLLDLRPDRQLLNAHFDGYKLTLQPLPKLRAALVTPPSRRHAIDDQYSYLHAQLFGTHNHLVRDAYASDRYYYVDVENGIRQIRYAAETGRLDETVRCVFAETTSVERHPGDYNATLQFVSGKLALLANGSGGLSVLETGDRQTIEDDMDNCLWRRSGNIVRPLDDVPNAERNKVSGDDDNDDDDDDDNCRSSPFILLDARLDTAAIPRRVHCVLLHVAKKTTESAVFESVIDVIELSESTTTKEWSSKRVRRVRSQGWPHYCALEARGAAILLASDREFVPDVERSNESQNGHAVVDDADTAKDKTLPIYEWHQQNDEICIGLDVKTMHCGNLQTADVRVISEMRRVCVTVNLQASQTQSGISPPLLDLQLYGDIDASKTTWLLANDTLKLTLMKAASKSVENDDEEVTNWPRLVADETAANGAIGVQTEFIENGRRDAFAMSGGEMEDLEDCDFGGNDAGREFFWERIDCSTSQRTHKCQLGTTAPLFTVQLGAGQPAALCLRNDVDVCVWQPAAAAAAIADDGAVDWRPKHVGTLDALGYVQASKTQKKYVQCSPDMRYAVISEAQRHVFIYQSHCAAAAGLKNRLSPAASAAAAKNVGQQRLFTMDGGTGAGAEIVGMQVDDEVTLLLTEKEVIGVQINA